MDNLAERQDRAMAVMERTFAVDSCPPRLAEPKGRDWWLAQPGAPKPKLQNEKPAGRTIRYEDLLSRWEEAG